MRPTEVVESNRPSRILSRAIAEHRLALDLLHELSDDFERAVELLRRCISRDGRILVCGNGGSAADAQHFASELTAGTPPHAAIALTVDSSTITALANDHGYETIFARQVRALGRVGDVLIGISTSGRSDNVLAALASGRAQSLHTIALTGAAGIGTECDLCLRVPSSSVQRIQELHGLLLHSLWEACR